MRHCRDGIRKAVRMGAGVVALIAALVVLVPFPASAAVTSGTSQTRTGDSLYQPIPFGGLSSFDTSNVAYNFPVVGMASTPDGAGYWLVASDGGVFSYGDAPFLGSLGSLSLNAPIVGIGGARNGDGYRLVGSDGGVFTFGAATYYGSLGGQNITYPIAGIAVDPDGGGYWLLPNTNLPTATLGTWTGIEPSFMQFSGDSGNIVSDIDWSSWSTASAVGVGAWGYDNCVPDCAGGIVTDYPATITLSNPSDGRFTELTEDQSGPFGSTFMFTLPGPALGASS